PLLSLIPLFLPLLPPPPLFLLFPYTTLFRSFHKTISKIAGYHQLFKLAGSGSWYPQFPYGQFYYFCLFTVIDRHHCFFFICKPAVADLLVIIGQKLYRSSQQFIIFLMDPDDILMKSDQFLILFSPWISPSVIGICETADSGFVPIINGGRSRPGHLNHNSFPENRPINPLFRRLASKVLHPSNLMVRSGEET